MQQLSKMNLKELKNKLSDGKYILFFSATWCPDCALIEPAMPSIVNDYPAYSFIKVDRDENIDLAAELNIFGIPSFVAFNKGKELGRLVNKEQKNKKQVEDFINSLDD